LLARLAAKVYGTDIGLVGSTATGLGGPTRISSCSARAGELASFGVAEVVALIRSHGGGYPL
jgi:hypothetical protein